MTSAPTATSSPSGEPSRLFSPLPLFTALALILVVGAFLLNASAQQTRDITRKHHLEDIEQSLFFARTLHGTFPPYDQTSWCGFLNDPDNQAVRSQIEEVLRRQNEKYANPAKPFPLDPLADQAPREAREAKWGNRIYDYFYWKRSPAVFELYAALEQEPTGERSTSACPGAVPTEYDYGLTSPWRENVSTYTL